MFWYVIGDSFEHGEWIEHRASSFNDGFSLMLSLFNAMENDRMKWNPQPSPRYEDEWRDDRDYDPVIFHVFSQKEQKRHKWYTNFVELESIDVQYKLIYSVLDPNEMKALFETGDPFPVVVKGRWGQEILEDWRPPLAKHMVARFNSALSLFKRNKSIRHFSNFTPTQRRYLKRQMNRFERHSAKFYIEEQL